jgi:hypothetical protein
MSSDVTISFSCQITILSPVLVLLSFRWAPATRDPARPILVPCTVQFVLGIPTRYTASQEVPRPRRHVGAVCGCDPGATPKRPAPP